MNSCLPGSSVHGIFQTRTLEWVAISYYRGSSPIQGSNLHRLCLLRWQADHYYHCATWEVLQQCKQRGMGPQGSEDGQNYTKQLPDLEKEL